jgi:peptidoglycan/LPS O-acetylase OafA/YrhL
MNSDSNKLYISPLTGFRFIAAFFVFLFHYKPFKKESLLWGICNEMYTGVTMFFVLSGFLIAYNYFEEAKPKFIFLKAYFIKRFARIYPVYFILTSVYFIYFFIKKPLPDAGFVYFLNISFLKGFSEKYMLTGLFQGWSLTVEECFYFLAPFIFWVAKKKKFLWPQTAVIILMGVLLVWVFNLYPSPVFFENFHFLFIGTFFGRCFEFFLGIQLAILFKRRNNRNKLLTSYYTFSGLIFVLLCLLVMNMVRIHFNIPHASSNYLGLMMNNVVFPMAVSVLIWGLLTEASWLSKLLSTKLFLVLGKASYVFYLIHAGLFADAITRFSGSHPAAKFLFCQAAAMVIFWTVEKPLNKKLRILFLGNHIEVR